MRLTLSYNGCKRKVLLGFTCLVSGILWSQEQKTTEPIGHGMPQQFWLSQPLSAHILHNYSADTVQLGLAYLKTGTYYFDQLAQADSALLYLDKAERLALKYKFPGYVLPDIYHAKSKVFHQLGNFETGLNSAFKGLYYLQQAKHSKQNEIRKARLYMMISNFFINSKELDKALLYWHKADSLEAQYPAPAFKASLFIIKGNLVYWSSGGKPEKSIPYFKQARAYSLEHGFHNQAFTATVNIAVNYYQMDSVRLAMQYLREALTQKNVNARLRSNAYGTLGEIYYVQKEYTKAEHYLKTALELALKFNIQENIFYAQKFLYLTYRAQGHYKKAMLCREQHDSLLAIREGKKIRQELNELEIKYKSSEKDKELMLKNMQLERQQNLLQTYTISGGCALLTLLLLLIAFRLRHIKQNGKIQMLQKEQQISTLKGVIQGEEQERSRIALELHDGIGARVAAAKLDVGIVQNRYPELPFLPAIFNSLEDTSREIREIAHNLLPAVLLKNTLREALFLYCNNLIINKSIDIELQYDEHIPDFNSDIKLIFYRIFQELIQNIVKHAQASKVFIQVRDRKGHLNITVEDNGLGFDVNNIKQGLGLTNIQLKVKSLEGMLDIQSCKGKGSTIFLSFNLHTLKNNHF